MNMMESSSEAPKVEAHRDELLLFHPGEVKKSVTDEIPRS